MTSPRPAAAAWGQGDSPSASGARPASPHVGTFFLGKYRVISEIGRGGMASVHLARIDGPGGFHRWVAIKRIHPQLVDNEQVIDMFLDEARVVAGISHANVTQVYELGKDEDSYWIAMEYLHGEPLREITRQLDELGTPMSPVLAAKICADAAEGLHAAHEARGKSGQLLGLVHRDVTPHNLFVTYEGCTKVVDFGIALATERLCAPTSHGQLKGKLAYMSPEQIRNEPVDRTTDIFALGIVLWELTTGKRLFRRDTDLDTLERAQACEVPHPSSLVADYPAQLEAIVLKALARRKHDRFGTAREMSRALQEFLLRHHSLIGPDEVAALLKQLFADRMARREEHLSWAAEVTATHDPAASAAAARWDSAEPTSESNLTPATDPLTDAATLAMPLRGATAVEEDTIDEESIATIAVRLSEPERDRVRSLRLGANAPPAAQSRPRPPLQPRPPSPEPPVQLQLQLQPPLPEAQPHRLAQPLHGAQPPPLEYPPPGAARPLTPSASPPPFVTARREVVLAMCFAALVTIIGVGGFVRTLLWLLGR